MSVRTEKQHDPTKWRPKRLRPTKLTSFAFGEAMRRAAAYHPDGNTVTTTEFGWQTADGNYRVPECCYELYHEWARPKGLFAGVSIETLGKLAFDVFMEELAVHQRNTQQARTLAQR